MVVLASVFGVLAVVAALGVAFRAYVLYVTRPNFSLVPPFPDTTFVVVALTNKLPRRNLNVVVLRRASIEPHDVILARPRAVHPALLARAVQTLQAERRASGRVPNHDAIVMVDHASQDLPPRVEEAERWVTSLQMTKAMLVPGLGTVPFIGLHVLDDERGHGQAEPDAVRDVSLGSR